MDTTSASRIFVLVAIITALATGGSPGVARAAAKPTIEFDMSVSSGAAGCVPNATAHVTVKSLGPVEKMTVKASGLPPHTGFDLFVIQVPTAPFGISAYEGDFETNGRGKGKLKVVGRFSVETFFIAPGTAAAPVVHSGAFPDASMNPSFNPIHTYHLGIWFDSSAAAHAAGCSATLTPFNGDHNAGIQVLNTAVGFANDQGPLRQLIP